MIAGWQPGRWIGSPLAASIALVVTLGTGGCTRAQPPSSTADMDEKPSGYRASGTEPFWTTVVTDSTVRHDELGKDEIVFDSVSATLDGEVRRITALGPSGTRLQLRLVPGPCRDAMADMVFEFTATVVIRGAGGSDTLRGCAKRGLAPAGEGGPNR
jgi:uncharacterized membrane protein